MNYAVWLIAFFIGIFIMYIVIKDAIDNSETAVEIREIKKLLEKRDIVKDEELKRGDTKEAIILNKEQDIFTGEKCPACEEPLRVNDKECPSCGLTLQ